MAKKSLFAALALMLASTMVSAGGLEPGSASGALEIGGYADVMYQNYDAATSTFVLGHVALDLTAELTDDVLVAAEIEWANAAPMANGGDADLVCAYIDCALGERATLRAGKFLVPFNVYNTQLYPADVAKLASVPFVAELSKWSETGIQVYGKIDTGTDAGLDYAVYYVNGLEADEDGEVVKNNDVDLNDSDKAIGGRIGVTTPGGIVLGLSGYKGAYSADGASDVTMLGLDFCYAYEAFEVRAEYVDASAEVTDADDVEADGFYLQGAYKFLDKYEAVVRYDELDEGGASIDRVTVGGNYTITDDLTFRLSYEWSDADAGDGLVGQLAVRF